MTESNFSHQAVVEEPRESKIESSKSKKTERKARMFRISFVDKSQHPQAKDIPSGFPAISVNGIVGGRLKLRLGYTYYFKVESTPEYPDVHFYLTLDSKGGPEDHRIPLAGTSNTLSSSFNLKITNMLPNTFYYQLREAPFAGGVCVVDTPDSN